MREPIQFGSGDRVLSHFGVCVSVIRFSLSLGLMTGSNERFDFSPEGRILTLTVGDQRTCVMMYTGSSGLAKVPLLSR